MSNIELIKPTMEFKEDVMYYKKAFLKNNDSFDGCGGLEDCNTYEEWLDFDNRLQKKYKESFVPSTLLLGVRKEDKKVIGMIDLRHRLSEFLFKYGGNIGYSVLPEERRKGYAKEMLRLMLEECKKMNLEKVLLTCDKENVGSYKTIIANGGILENEIKDDVNLSKSGIIQRYWINI